MGEDERRTTERVEAITVVELAQGVHGVTRNVSGTGLLIATRTRFLVGDRLELTIHAKSGSFKTAGRVVRVDETGPKEPWRYRIAVHLDEPVPENVVEDGIASAAKLLGRASSIPPRS